MASLFGAIFWIPPSLSDSLDSWHWPSPSTRSIAWANNIDWRRNKIQSGGWPFWTPLAPSHHPAFFPSIVVHLRTHGQSVSQSAVGIPSRERMSNTCLLACLDFGDGFPEGCKQIKLFSSTSTMMLGRPSLVTETTLERLSDLHVYQHYYMFPFSFAFLKNGCQRFPTTILEYGHQIKLPLILPLWFVQNLNTCSQNWWSDLREFNTRIITHFPSLPFPRSIFSAQGEDTLYEWFWC